MLGKELVQAVLVNLETAPLDEAYKEALRFAVKMARTPTELGAEDIGRLRALGLSDQDIRDIAKVVALFSMINRMADSLGWDPGSQTSHDRSAFLLIKKGYL